MENILKVCIILHKIVYEERPAGYSGSRSCRLHMESEDLETPQPTPVIFSKNEKGAGFWQCFGRNRVRGGTF